MTTEELRERIENNGLDHTLRRWLNEPTDNEEIRIVFEKARLAMDTFDDAASELSKALGL